MHDCDFELLQYERWGFNTPELNILMQIAAFLWLYAITLLSGYFWTAVYGC